jgi:type IV secretory pathway VirB10-like protein
MAVRPAIFLLLATLAAAAAGAGGWLAVRQNRADAASEGVAAASPTGPGGLAPRAVAAAGPAPAPAPLAPQAPVAAAEPVTAVAAEPEPPVVREPEVPASQAAATAAATDRPAPARTAVTAEAAVTAPDARATPEAAAAAPETPPDLPVTAPDPALAADAAPAADRAAAVAPPTVPSPDVAWRSASSDLPRVDGWVRSTETAVPVDPEPLPVEQLVIGADSVIGLQVETTVSSAAAEVEDDVDARVTRDVMVGDRVAIPAGTRVRGSVVLVEQAGKLRGTPRLGVRFHTAFMDDGAELPITTETVYREGPARGSESTRRIGGAAVGGAILGAIFGGRRGAAIGSAAGAAGGTAMAVAHNGPPASFPAGARVTIRLLNSTAVRVDRLRPGSR